LYFIINLLFTSLFSNGFSFYSAIFTSFFLPFSAAYGMLSCLGLLSTVGSLSLRGSLRNESALSSVKMLG
jgi:hypothetical protein